MHIGLGLSLPSVNSLPFYQGVGGHGDLASSYLFSHTDCRCKSPYLLSALYAFDYVPPLSGMPFPPPPLRQHGCLLREACPGSPRQSRPFLLLWPMVPWAHPVDYLSYQVDHN